MTSPPRTISAAQNTVVSRNGERALVSEISRLFSGVPFAPVARIGDVGGISVLSSCDCVVYNGRSRPA